MVSRSRFWWKSRYFWALLLSIAVHLSIGLLIQWESKQDEMVSPGSAVVINLIDIEIVEPAAPVPSVEPAPPEEHESVEESSVTESQEVSAESSEEILVFEPEDNSSEDAGDNETETQDNVFNQPTEEIAPPTLEELSMGLNLPMPQYPDGARRWGHEGEVAVSILIDEQGGIRELELIESSGSPFLDQSVLTTLEKSWYFHGTGRVETIVTRFEFYLQ